VCETENGGKKQREKVTKSSEQKSGGMGGVGSIPGKKQNPGGKSRIMQAERIGKTDLGLWEKYKERRSFFFLPGKDCGEKRKRLVKIRE